MCLRLFFLSALFNAFCCLAEDQPTVLRVAEKKIQINNKEAVIYSLEKPDGTQGIKAKKGQKFNVLLENKLNVPTSIHWHGLILPNNQDGVAYVTQFPLYPGLSYRYEFPIVQAGTFWMHSHFFLQEQRLLSAPLILSDDEDAKLADKEVVIMLTDFSFSSPEEILRNLRCSGKKMAAMAGMSQEMSKGDLVDVEYDAFLTNARTLENPEIVEVAPGMRMRLRFINGSSATNFFLSLGKLEGEAIAVDGNRIKPLKGSQFELAVAQRIDVIVKIPEDIKVALILAQGEGTDKQTGILLAVKGAEIPKLSSQAPKKAGALTNVQELLLQALAPLPQKEVDQRIVVELGGNMQEYTWTLNGQSWPMVTPIVVEKGNRVEMVFRNKTAMAHPMHFHGHVFQVVRIDDKTIQGAIRDTVLVTPDSTLAIQFDADNPGVWPLTLPPPLPPGSRNDDSRAL